MFQYGFEQHPDVPSPQIRIRISSPQMPDWCLEIEAVVDTGAVMSCIPKDVAEKLAEGGVIHNIRRFRGASGRTQVSLSYYLNVSIASCDFQDVELLALDKEYALVGRDILNLHIVCFDGPGKTWRVEY